MRPVFAQRLLLADFFVRRPGVGFTLVEILLVLILMALAAAFAMPHFSRSYQQLLRDQLTEDLAYRMRYAQSRAVSQNRKVVLVFDDQRKSYWLEEDPAASASETPEPELSRVPGSFGRPRDIPEDIAVDFSQGKVSFLPDGTIDKVTIELKERDPHSENAFCQRVSTEIQRGAVILLECESGK